MRVNASNLLSIYESFPFLCSWISLKLENHLCYKVSSSDNRFDRFFSSNNFTTSLASSEIVSHGSNEKSGGS
jgi:hypothetical protein